MNANAHYRRRIVRVAPIASRMCVNHPMKWAQSAGLCRMCERLAEHDRRAAFELAQEQRDYESRQKRYREAAAPIRPTLRTITTRGYEFDIVWDGSIR